MAPAPLLLLLGGCAVATSGASTTVTLGAEQIPIAVSRPDGPGPFPAVVIMHDCSGLGPTASGAPGRWARELVARGYVVVMPDSFTPRGHAGGDSAAWADSIREVMAFFDRHLRQTKEP